MKLSKVNTERHEVKEGRQPIACPVEDQSCIVFIRFTFYAENWECFIIFGHVATNTIQTKQIIS